MALSKAALELRHLYNRAGFGMDPATLPAAEKFPSRSDAVDRLLRQAASKGSTADYTTELPVTELMDRTDRAAVEAAVKRSHGNILSLGAGWLNSMASGASPLLDRMTLFWHDHFASSAPWDKLVAIQHATIRKHALGSFRDLLTAMSTDPMLLRYLDNDQNRKQKPNENFTRELMELFTLGEGSYTEADIREGARALTGHAFNREGNYFFRAGLHDYGNKQFMGRSGRLDRQDIVDILLEQEDTAQHLSRKIYRYFVHPEVDESFVNSMAQRFYRSDYDIADLLHYLFSSDAFYAPKNIGAKVKSPVDLLTGLMRQAGISRTEPLLLAGVLKMMGQVPFFPPNVAGWPLGEQWIDSSSLLFRMRLADFLLLGREVPERVKTQPEDDVRVSRAVIEAARKNLRYDLSAWENVARKRGEPPLDLLALWSLPVSQHDWESRLRPWVTASGRNFEEQVLNLMRLPEYQLS